ncbi:MAG: response regulator [Betaproteobacteria bacterium]|nr:response regulator [Betaproteobacteria bacterium]
MPTQSGDIPATLDHERSGASEAQERVCADTETVRLFMDSLPAGLGVGYAALAIIAVCLYRLGVSAGVAWWTGTVAAALSACLLAYWRYRRESPAAMSLRRWGRRFTWLASASALAWGSAAFFFMPAPPAVEMMVVLGVTAVAVGGIGHLAMHLPCYFGFLLGSMVPFVVAFLLLGDALHAGLAAGMAALVAAAAGFGHFMNRTMRRSIVLAHRNRQLAEALAERTREAEQANAAKSRFLASASHDLRQPVHAIGLLLGVLRGQALQRAQAEIVDRLARSCEALEELFDGILGVSRLDAGAETPRLTAVPVHLLFTALHSAFEPLAREKGLQLRTHDCHAVVHSDPALLERVLANLVSNAIRYTHAGGVLLASRRRGAAVSIEVWDTGIGIEAQHQGAIFEEFFQCGNTERDRRRGLGLGLAIVKRLAGLLQHTVEFRSVSGRGSVFRVRVPAFDGPVPEVADTQLPGPAVRRVAGTRVLVVDDEPGVRDATVALLRQWNCEVIALGSMAEVMSVAVEWASAPDVVVSDLRLPDACSGTDLVAWLREEFNREIPALLVSGDAHSATFGSSLPPGTVLLAKPASATAMLETLVSLRSLPASRPVPEAVV